MLTNTIKFTIINNNNNNNYSSYKHSNLPQLSDETHDINFFYLYSIF